MMKYLLVLAVVLVAFFIWQHKRRARALERARQEQEKQQAQRQARPAPLAAPDAIVTCRHCGLHLPSRDAAQGTLGYYCGQEHRHRAEG